MQILVTVPNANFSVADVKRSINASGCFNGDQIYYLSDHPDFDPDQIDVMVGYDAQLLSKMLANPDAKLKWVQALSAGIDYLPLKQLAKRQVLVSTVKGIHAEPIAETVIGMVLGNYRFIEAAARSQGWLKPDHQLQMIKNKRAVVFGTGHIGSRIAELLAAFGAQVTGVNHDGHPVASFHQTVRGGASDIAAVADADLIINTLPLTDATRDFYNARFFAGLKQHPLFISIGRGPSTNTADLLAAVQNGQLSGAGLDVTDPEPLPEDHPLWQQPNVLITSHISGMHAEYMDEAVAILAKNAAQFKKTGTLAVNPVDLNQGY